METKIATQFAGFVPAIRFTVSCSCCGNINIPENKLAGLLTNRKNNLASDIINLKNQISNLNPKKEQATMIIMDTRLLKLEQELCELGQKEIWFNGEFLALRS